jgi:hypothetical protein
MKERSQFEQWNPAGFMTAIGMNQQSNDAVSKTVQTWFDKAGQVQSEMLSYWSKRYAHDAQTLQRLAKCKSPQEIWAAQAEWANGLYRDFAAGGKAAAEGFESVIQGTRHAGK